MADVHVTQNSYTVGGLYQWDRNQELTIYGLSVPGTPVVHFAHGGLEDALVQTTTMDAAGVIRSVIPNELLEEALPIKAYVCAWEGDKFRSLRCIVIPVQSRARPGAYEEEEANG